MNQANVSPLQVHQMRKLPDGMSESHHLSQAYLTAPEKMDSVLAYAFGESGDSVLSMLTGGLGNTRYITNREYTWDLHGQSERTVRIAGEPLSGGLTPGLGGQPFEIALEERYDDSDILVLDDESQVRVFGEPQPGNGGFVHRLVPVDPNQEFIDPEVLKPGCEVLKDYSTVEEYSAKGGGTKYSAPMTLKNQLTTLRKTFKVTRSAATDVMVVELYGPNGEKTRMWTKLQEWHELAAWQREIDRSMIYSIHNKNAQGTVDLKGSNGRPVYHGAGFRQQISPANKRPYTKLTYEILDDILLDLSFAANNAKMGKKFVALTGQMGMREFQRAVTDRQKELGITVTDHGTFISGSGQELTLQGQFTTVKFLNGVELTVKHFPPYDDEKRNRRRHPVSGRPLESYRFSIINFGTTAKGKPNIRKVAKAQSENAMWHVSGSTSPFSGVAKDMSTERSSGIDGYEVHTLTEFGIQVEDPTSCAELYMELG